MHRISVLVVLVLALSGCDGSSPVTVVKAVAAGVPSLAPFFDEGSGLGKDEVVRSRPVQGSLQQGDTPGLYGGSKQATVCDVEKLERFLTDPGNHQKALAWASVPGIGTDEIPEYLDRLTPVLLRHDTLVENHDYKKGKAVPYNSLLQAGIAILVDEQGLPAVKCSCGNPLRPFRGDTGRISLRFEDGNKKWTGYKQDSVVAVRPAPLKLERLALVDVREPERGIDRPVGTAGEKDHAFDTRERKPVPDLTGVAFEQASRKLTAAGLATGYAGKAAPPAGAKVTATDPAAGTELRFGEYVMLTVAGGSSSGAGGPDGSSGSGGATKPTTTPPPPSSGSSGSSGASGAGSSSSSGKPGESSSAPPSSSSGSPDKSSSAPPSHTAPSSHAPSESTGPPSPDPPSPDPPSPPPAAPPSSSAPTTTSAPPPPPPPPPPSSEPASSAPATDDGPSTGVAA
ncbi:PASTA domain-containing protein [Streptomyces sp. NPDC047072]|uniref:PASTA domain-containing protein n=1 Tax=Streptomyces sp. NPDC047072 TaxID=3154809 RepID=UPI0033CC570A